MRSVQRGVAQGTTTAAEGEGRDNLECPVCDGVLDLVQPCEERPHHLVGSCAWCGGVWGIRLGQGGPILDAIPTEIEEAA